MSFSGYPYDLAVLAFHFKCFNYFDISKLLSTTHKILFPLPGQRWETDITDNNIMIGTYYNNSSKQISRTQTSVSQGDFGQRCPEENAF